MILGLLKWLTETIFCERTKEIIIKTWTLLVKKVYIKKKGRMYEFSDTRKTELMDFWK